MVSSGEANELAPILNESGCGRDDDSVGMLPGHGGERSFVILRASRGDDLQSHTQNPGGRLDPDEVFVDGRHRRVPEKRYASE